MIVAGLTMAVALSFAAAVLPSTAWEVARVPRIGYLGNSSPELESALVDAFPFAGARCNRITDAVLRRIGIEDPPQE